MDSYKIDGMTIHQPDEEMGYSFETTYSDDTARTQDGILHATPLFTVEQSSYKATNIPVADAAKILQKIVKGRTFSYHYFSPYYGVWRDDTFYVGQGSLSIGTLSADGARLSELSFNMTGVNPI